jgi:hypothetical protein
VRTDTRLGTYEDSFAGADPEIAAIGAALRRLIEEIHPDAMEVARPGEQSVAYGLGPKKMSEAYAYLMPQARWLNLGFYHGSEVPDPAGLLEGTGARLRHVKLPTMEAAMRPEVRALIEAALAERRAALGVG